MKNNKGFSLVELIIVIAIMAILVGVMAPQLIKYIEKTNVSSDIQLCDSVRTAITTAVMDPDVVKAGSATITNGGVSSCLTGSAKSVAEEILGVSLSSVNTKLKSKNASGLEVASSDNSIKVYDSGDSNIFSGN